MQRKGKIVKRIAKYFPELPIDDAVKKFFGFYYFECGLSTSEIIRYLLNGNTHSTFVHLAKRYDIELEGKGGNIKKYKHYMECDCGNYRILQLLIKNKDKHNNLTIKCDKCFVGELK